MEQNFIELDKLIEHFGFGTIQLRLLAMCAIGYFAVCSELLATVMIESTLESTFHLSNIEYAMLPFFTSLIGLIASIVFGIISDIYGRKKPFIISIVFVIFGGIMSILCTTDTLKHFYFFIIFRSFVSIGLSGIAAIDFILFMEFLPKTT